MRRTSKWLGLVWLLWAGCAQPTQPRSDELEGTPPPPSEDPFFFVAIPADAVAADTQGMIGGSADPETEPDPKTSVVPSKPVEVNVEPALTSPVDPALPLPKQEPTHYACFSCVEICLVDNDLTRCGDKEDTICGWGVHPSRDDASNLAQVQCNGALDIARESVRFARIEGSCPIATCEAQ